MRSSYETLIAAVVLGTTAIHSNANIVGPYTADGNTLHLWHMDQTTVPVLDSVLSGGTNFTVLTNGATLGNASFPGFGTALSAWQNSYPIINAAHPPLTQRFSITRLWMARPK